VALTSMTGFADLAGGTGGLSWNWEARSVNGRGLDVRLRLADGFESLDSTIRSAAARHMSRGSVSIGLRLAKGTAGSVPRLNPAALEAAVAAALAASEVASRSALDLAPMTAADLLGMRGVLETEPMAPGENEAVLAQLTGEAETLLSALAASRTAEGVVLGALLAVQLDRIESLTIAARELAEVRAGRTGALLRTRVEAVLAATAAIDETRLAQELALVAVRADVTEEIDRLQAHVAAARSLLASEGAVGRKLDFLMQEFNREANTLCSKAGSSELTAIGLDLKVIIDQMREQVQNVE
jgi:uncharacterized protein (TIGR00255 family)